MYPWAVLFLATMQPVTPGWAEAEATRPLFAAEDVAPVTDERAEHLVPLARERSKKELWLAEKAHRPDVHVSDDQLRPPRAPTPNRKPAGRPACAAAEQMLSGPKPAIGQRVQPLTTLHNQWTHELMSFIPGQPFLERFRAFMRDHFTNQAALMDPELVDVLVSAALYFRAARVDIVSGYRSPKYNMILRKKGHQVARESQHTLGTAVDFRIRGVPTEKLLNYVRSLRLGGVGFYPHTRFVHTDTGRIRYWKGT
jgi:uncharacterized protein YcbK (DUF882 family)